VNQGVCGEQWGEQVEKGFLGNAPVWTTKDGRQSLFKNHGSLQVPDNENRTMNLEKLMIKKQPGKKTGGSERKTKGSRSKSKAEFFEERKKNH